MLRTLEPSVKVDCRIIQELTCQIYAPLYAVSIRRSMCTKQWSLSTSIRWHLWGHCLESLISFKSWDWCSHDVCLCFHYPSIPWWYIDRSRNLCTRYINKAALFVLPFVPVTTCVWLLGMIVLRKLDIFVHAIHCTVWIDIYKLIELHWQPTTCPIVLKTYWKSWMTWN